MGLYVCENCKCVENTSKGQYWSKDSGIYPKEFEGKALCSECGSPTFKDGGKTGLGKWHGYWEKKHIEDYLVDNPKSDLMYLKGKYKKDE